MSNTFNIRQGKKMNIPHNDPKCYQMAPAVAKIRNITYATEACCELNYFTPSFMLIIFIKNHVAILLLFGENLLILKNIGQNFQ